MAAHQIKVTIFPGGKIEIEVNGIKGSACEIESKWLDSLGEVIEHKSTKDRFLTSFPTNSGKVGN
jgi:hypothetical protein